MCPEVRVKCKNCGGFAPAEQFKLHYSLRMMVCPNCYSGKTAKKEEEKKVEPARPAGWDAEDEYLRKYHQIKEKEKPKFKKIPGTDYFQYTCKSCDYEFKYDPYKKVPRNCPYCNEAIPKIEV